MAAKSPNTTTALGGRCGGWCALRLAPLDGGCAQRAMAATAAAIVRALAGTGVPAT